MNEVRSMIAEKSKWWDTETATLTETYRLASILQCFKPVGCTAIQRTVIAKSCDSLAYHAK